MRVLLVGGGGREHALAWALARSPAVDGLLFAPGNAGMAALGECVPVKDADVDGLTALAVERGAGLVVVGPEAPLVAGLGDALRARDVKVFGPGRRGALLEGSKSYAKRLMNERGIPTARAVTFERAADALGYVERAGAPIVVKADGLAAGKGVTVCEDAATARAAITEAMEGGRFGEAGRRVVLEERLQGPELSVLAFSDGRTILPMQPAQDFKRAHDDDRGPNTGGMGSYSPVPVCTPEVMDRIAGEILEPIGAALAAEGEPYVGVIYAGLMLTPDGPKVIEFNCRFGDPETQALIPRLGSDLAEAMVACVEGSLGGVRLTWRPEACVTVVAASEGYPGSYETGLPIRGLDDAARIEDAVVFHAGTRPGPGGSILTSGGRVLAVSGTGDGIEAARSRAYEALSLVSFDGMWSRSDIASSAAALRS
jgi:phosphoribosylamine---glycine ligase